MGIGIILLILAWVVMGAVFIITAYLKSYSMRLFGTIILAAATAGCIGVIIIIANLFFNFICWLF